MPRELYIAVDLGAGSGRVFLAGVDDGELRLDEIHRFRYPPSENAGRLRWDITAIFEQITAGIREAASLSRQSGRTIRSIGVDSWGVDYGFVGPDGELTADPVCYRDPRTEHTMEEVFREVPRRQIFERTGIQFLRFNTVFQLFSDREELQAEWRLLLIPDLINYFLTGRMFTEYTNATTTQLVNSVSGDWDMELIERLRFPSGMFLPIVPAGTEIGELKPDLAKKLQTGTISVVAPATHDTGSAVVAAPMDDRSAYISSGTWSLIGVELTEPLIDEEAATLNFTNEGGAFGTFRFLKNVMGLWLFECCRREWAEMGRDVEYDTLVSTADVEWTAGPLIFPDDERFLNPPSMLAAIADQLRETGQDGLESPAEISRMIFDSLAFRYASVLRSISDLSGRTIDNIQILGGGGRNRYLNQMTADATGMRVQAGLTEATVLGNVLVQAIASGRFASLVEARDHVRRNARFDQYLPRSSRSIAEAERRYKAIEKRYLQ